MRIFAFFCLTLTLLSGCHSKDPATLTVGAISGPEVALLETAQQVAKEKYQLNITIVEFEDYSMPNRALAEGNLDANVFQHEPYLQEAVAGQHYEFFILGRTFVFPMGIYSHTLKKLDELMDSATVGIPNDPSNQARALRLLATARLITLNAVTTPSVHDIVDNPKQLKFIEADSAQLPRTLEDVSIAIINTNYAVASGLNPAQDSLLLEAKDSPYANLIVCRSQDKEDPRFRQLVEAYHDEAVVKQAEVLFNHNAIVAW